ncbi:unnamed protein product [Parajaminaea phylloscopi]
MFVLSTIEDTLFLPGSSFNATTAPTQPATSAKSLALAINTKYANRVIPDVGLCICLFDILEASEGIVKWGDGGLWHSVKARLAVFRPFIGEALVGKVMSSDESGIRVSMGFFDDIHIPVHLMPEPSAFDHHERAFFWLYSPSHPSYLEDPLNAPQEERMYLDRDESIRFVVEDDIFEEGEPVPGLAATGAPAHKAGSAAAGGAGGTGAIGGGVTLEALEAAKAKRKPPFRITASIAGQGLGLVRWWVGASDSGAEGYEEMATEEQ